MKAILVAIFLVVSSFSSELGIDWRNNVDDAKEAAIREKKPIILFLHSRSCFYCPKIIENVLPDSKVDAFLEKNFIKLALDTSTGSDSIEEDVSDQAPPRFIVSITPAFIFMGPNEEKLARNGKKHMIIYGFWTPEQLIKWGNDALNRFHRLYGKKYGLEVDK
ncbi:MAG: thioredoxin family protein [Epsilonproteobacteria bacterium]|nr:thioredoxin family protein [Campylobacterota bacterium]